MSATDRHLCTEPDARLDKIVSAMPSVGSRRRAREAIDTGKVTINGQVALPEQAGLPVPQGATVEVCWTRPGTAVARKKGEAGLAQSGLRILFEDRDMVAVDKPPGLLTDVADTTQARERDSVKKRLTAWLRPKGLSAQVCHRIDRDTSGVVLFATHDAATEQLRGQFARHEPDRFYWVAVHGSPEGDGGTWENWMMWDRVQLRQRPCGPRSAGAVLARATWRVVERFANAAILQVQLDTGRRNQIRLQASLAGHPLLGERLYLPPGFRAEGEQPPRQALHARKVTVKHPGSGKPISFEAELPPDLVALVARLRRG